MEKQSKSIVLVGMAGAGKSTVGPLVAGLLRLNFQDADTIIEGSQGCSLQELLDTAGVNGFQQIERAALLGLETDGFVTATGGSAIYYPDAMAHLARDSTIVWLDVPEEEICSRVNNQHNRGLVIRAGTTLPELFRERYPLYRQYADIQVDCSGKTPVEIARDISRIIDLRA